MPVTSVQKITKVMIMVISRMKASPSGFMATAVAGAHVAQNDRHGYSGENLKRKARVEGLLARAERRIPVRSWG